MASKVIFSIFMVLLVVSAKAHKLNNAIDDLLDKLDIVAKDALDSSQKLLDASEQTLIKLSNSTLSSAESDMEKTEETLTDKLAAIKQNATEHDVNIDECLGENETNLTNLTTDFTVDLSLCINITVNVGLSYVQKSQDDMTKMVGEVSGLRDDVKACKGAFMCLTKLTAKVSGELVSLPAKIGANAATAVSQIGLLSLQIDSCKTKKTNSWTTKGEDLLATIRECASNISN